MANWNCNHMMSFEEQFKMEKFQNATRAFIDFAIEDAKTSHSRLATWSETKLREHFEKFAPKMIFDVVSRVADRQRTCLVCVTSGDVPEQELKNEFKLVYDYYLFKEREIIKEEELLESLNNFSF